MEFFKDVSGVKMKVYSLDGGDYSVYLTDVNVVR